MVEKELPELYPGWKTVRKIGAGSFGSVYEIERNLFGKIEKAALKCITIPQNDGDVEEMYSNGYDDASITAHFEKYLADIVQEYSLMAEMKGHTNVVYCDDIRYTPREDGIGWEITIKMELLTPLIRALGPNFGEEQVIRLGKDICRALVLCRDKDIVHRDIKPQNIFVSKTGDYKLGDFGIAKTVERTTGGTKIGTYSYMAPEVYHSKPYGSSADLYSLGLVMYWLLNERRLPFLPLPPKSPTYEETETARHRRFMGEKLPEPKNGSAALKEIVLKACTFEPKDRFATAQEMLDALSSLTTVCKEPEPIPAEVVVPVQTEIEDDRTMGLFITLKSESKPELSIPQPEPKREPKPESKPEPKPEPKRELKPDPKPEPKRELKPDPKPEPKLDHKPEPKPAPKPEPKIVCNPVPTQKKKPIGLFCAAALLLVGIVMFFCVHIWTEPTCDTPATCKICGKTQGKSHNCVDGICLSCGMRPVVDIATGGYHTVVIREDGSVDAIGRNRDGQCNIAEWKDIVDISAGAHFTLGLKSDGTVVATGDNEEGQCNVSSWTDITAISAGETYALGLNKDGTVVVAGSFEDKEGVLSWCDVIAIAAGYDCAAGLLSDGTVVCCGPSWYNTSDWSDIVAIDAGVTHMVGVTAQSTVITTDENNYLDVSKWRNVVAVATGNNCVVGLKADGTMVATGSIDNEFDEVDYRIRDVKQWSDIAMISAGDGFVVGLKSNGELVAVGDNSEGQCDVSQLNR